MRWWVNPEVQSDLVRFRRLLDLILVEIDRSLNISPNLKLAGVLSTLTRRTSHGVPTREATTICRLPSALSFELADGSVDDIIARQRTLIGDSLDNEHWSDDLSNQPLN